VQLAYRQNVDQASRVVATMQTGSGLLRLLADPSDSEMYDFAHARLAKVEDALWLEVALMYDTNGRIQVAPRNPLMEGKKYDPSGIVADTLRTGKRLMRS
jgi:hypothetical protein